MNAHISALCVWVWAYTVLTFSLQYSNSKMKLLNCSLLLLLASGSSAFSPIAFAPRQPSALGVAVDTSDIKNGMTLELEGEPYKVLSFSIMKQARGAAKTTIKFKNLIRGTTIENTYRSGEKFETALIEKMAHQFTYAEGNSCFFMNTETFEEVPVPSKIMDDKTDWIEEGMEVNLVFFKGNVIEVVLPNVWVYQVAETEPNMKGNTSSGYTKPAVLSCGATINVPGYLEQGEMIKVDTEKKVYLERVSK